MRGLFFVCGAGGGGEWLAPQARKSWCAWAGAGAVLFELVVEVELLEGWRRRREKSMRVWARWGILPQGIVPVTAACDGRPLPVTAACNGRPLSVAAAC